MKNALVIVDLQNDFCPGGALAVPEGDRIVPTVNRYIDLFRAAGLPVFATRDWHPERTIHFTDLGGKWPPHCIQGTRGAAFHPELRLPHDAIIITKGNRPNEDSYSGFEGKDKNGRNFKETLAEAGVDHLYVCGLATDYCVKQTALDAIREDFRVTLLLDAVKGVDLSEGDSERAVNELIEKGATAAIIEEVEVA